MQSEMNGKPIMETPVQIEFQGMNATEQIRKAIDQHIAELEDRFGRATACRVVVRAPSGRHRNGGQYDVNVRLVLPNGREVNIDRTASEDERHADFAFALNDAFKRARRQLQDEVRLMRGDVKVHEEPPLGTIVRLDSDGGFGFLETSDGHEIYFHQNSVLNEGFRKLAVGTRVAFVETTGDQGPRASTVRLVGKQRPR
jgi:cold shock CspA family protein/ribosome-associated translation inhibitor RaiA